VEVKGKGRSKGLGGRLRSGKGVQGRQLESELDLDVKKFTSKKKKRKKIPERGRGKEKVNKGWAVGLRTRRQETTTIIPRPCIPTYTRPGKGWVKGGGTGGGEGKSRPYGEKAKL